MKTIGALMFKTVRIAVVAAVFALASALLLNFLPVGESLSKYAVHAGMILAAWFCARLFDRLALRELGISSLREDYRQFLFGGGLAILTSALMGAAMILTGEMEPDHLQAIRTDPPLIFETLLFCIWIGVAEELLFRGYFLSLWRKHGFLHPGIFMSALLFSAVHIMNPSYGPLAFLAAFLIGLLYGYMFLAAGNLWMPIGHHIAWNFCQMLFFPPEGGELAAIILVAASFPVVFLYFRSRKKANFQA